MLLDAKDRQNFRDFETAPTSITLCAHNVLNPPPAFKMLARSSAKTSQVMKADSTTYDGADY